MQTTVQRTQRTGGERSKLKSSKIEASISDVWTTNIFHQILVKSKISNLAISV